MKLDIVKLKQDFYKFSSEWENSTEYNDKIYDYFETQVDSFELLKDHYNIITENELGYGEKAFRYLWALVFSQINANNLKFLEIGVYKGSILTLSQLIGEQLGINIISYGLTPLNKTGDRYSIYDDADYKECIKECFIKTKAPTKNSFIINGLSTDDRAKKKVLEIGEFDVIYVDGGHDYNTVVNDIDLCDQILKSKGLLVLDDGASLLNLSIKTGRFKGHYEVGLAIKDKLENNINYKHLFACGNNRVFQKF
jgi:hypothetical protein